MKKNESIKTVCELTRYPDGWMEPELRYRDKVLVGNNKRLQCCQVENKIIVELMLLYLHH